MWVTYTWVGEFYVIKFGDVFHNDIVQSFAIIAVDTKDYSRNVGNNGANYGFDGIVWWGACVREICEFVSNNQYVIFDWNF